MSNKRSINNTLTSALKFKMEESVSFSFIYLFLLEMTTIDWRRLATVIGDWRCTVNFNRPTID
jgi:hypothetical protein